MMLLDCRTKQLPNWSAIYFAIFWVGWAATLHAETVIRPRIICLDKSGSMQQMDGSKSRFQHSVELIRQLAVGAPPTPAEPMVVIYFTEHAAAPQIIDSKRTLDRFLSSLSPGGGTSIAAGLRQASDVLTRYSSAQSIEVLLVTDGEDSDVVGISAAQDELNRIFEIRRESSLSNTVFLRTWSTETNRALAEPIIKAGNAEVHDLSQAKFIPVNVETSGRLIAANWHPGGNSLRAKMTFQARSSDNDARVRSDVILIADRSQDRIRLVANGPAIVAELDVPIARNQLDAGTIDLGFTVTCRGLQSGTGNDVYEVTPSPSHIAIHVPLPVLEIELRIAVRAVGRSRWLNLPTERSEAEYELFWESANMSSIRPNKCEVSLEGAEKPEIRQGKSATLDGITGSVRFSVSASVPSLAVRKWKLKLTPDNSPHQTILPVVSELEFTAPPPVTVRLEPAQGPYRSLVEGNVHWSGSRVQWPVRLAVMGEALPKDVIDKLEFEFISESPECTPGKICIDEPSTLQTEFRRSSGIVSKDLIDATVNVASIGNKISSVQIGEPMRFVVLRDSKLSVIIVVVLTLITAAILGYAVYQGLIGRVASTTSVPIDPKLDQPVSA